MNYILHLKTCLVFICQSIQRKKKKRKASRYRQEKAHLTGFRGRKLHLVGIYNCFSHLQVEAFVLWWKEIVMVNLNVQLDGIWKQLGDPICASLLGHFQKCFTVEYRISLELMSPLNNRLDFKTLLPMQMRSSLQVDILLQVHTSLKVH